MDQIPLPFVLDDGKTYEIKVVKEVWAQSEQSGLDKQQATVQLTVFADGVDRVRSTVIFNPIQDEGIKKAPNQFFP